MCNKRERVFQTAGWFSLPHNMVAFKILQNEFGALSLSKGALLWDDPDWDQWSEITRIMANQMNWWILVQSGLIGSFDLQYMIQVMSDHKWSWSGLSQRNALQDNLGFWIPCHGFQSRNCIPDSLSVELGFWIPIVSRIPNSLSCIFRNPMPRIPDLWIPLHGAI